MADKSFSKLRNFIFNQLESGLIPKLYYHSIEHTRSEVLPAVEAIARRNGVTEKDILILQTAALLHDAGYLNRYENNEPVAAQMARKLLPSYNYSKNQIETIANLILATTMPQEPDSLLEKIQCDADLSSLSSDEFFISSMKLWREICTFQEPVSLKAWLKRQRNFLAEHSDFTQTAKDMFYQGKKRNFNELDSILTS